jgi:DNA repair exonuclease SbcCD ATPase subunit
LRIKRLIIQNFKGIKNFTFEPNGKNVNVFGMNETGKTTMVDACLWLLFGKDSEDKKDFAIKPLDENNNPIPGLEVMVECEFMDGLTLKKTYYEKWVKQKGSADRVFSGNTTDYFIDGVPTKAGDYADHIKSMATEDVFKLLTNPLYFNEGLHWTKRRELLIAVCGDITDEDVINSDKKLQGLAEILGNLTFEKMKLKLASQRKEINEQLDKLPVRIDEADKSTPDISGMDFAKIDADIKALQADTKEKRIQIERIENGGETAELQKKLSTLDAEIQKIKNEHNEAKDKALREIRNQKSDVEDKIHNHEREISNLKTEKTRHEGTVSQHEKRLINLREQWKEIQARTFECPEMETVCPTCGQDLPEDKVEEAKQKALEAFNLKKANDLEENSKQGKEISVFRKQAQENITKVEGEMLKTEDEISKLNLKLDTLQTALENTEKKYQYITTPGYQEKVAERDRIAQKIADEGKDKGGETKLIALEIEGLEEEINALQTQYAKKEQHGRAEARIKELMAEQKKLAAEYEEIERQLFLMDEFTKQKVAMLDSKINSKFKYARFKMFNTLVNGGIEDCCETLVTNSKTGAQVPFSSANNGGRILVGCDIISTLSEHYGFSPVVFIDNYESITSPVDMQAQVIKLVVSETDKELRVEVEE